MNVLIIGCGALAELYYAPAILAIQRSSQLTLAALIDPDASRRQRLSPLFPAARSLASIKELSPGYIDLAIIASPPRFHAEHTEALLSLGAHVLCEKPMATNTADARRMIEAARVANRLLSVGLFRRFFPSSIFIKDLITNQNLGAPRSFEWAEGGPFSWPAASPSFFQKSASAGGVFADMGSHVIDLLLWWFGQPNEFTYEDDSMGGLEANACLALSFPCGVTGKLRLSRDTAIMNGSRVRFERGSVWFRGASADEVVIELEGCSSVTKSRLHHPPRHPQAGAGAPAHTYTQSFIAQLSCFAAAIRENVPPRVTAAEALVGQELIERCYAARRPMHLPWLSLPEQAGVERLIGRSPARKPGT